MRKRVPLEVAKRTKIDSNAVCLFSCQLVTNLSLEKKGSAEELVLIALTDVSRRRPNMSGI